MLHDYCSAIVFLFYPALYFILETFRHMTNATVTRCSNRLFILSLCGFVPQIVHIFHSPVRANTAQDFDSERTDTQTLE